MDYKDPDQEQLNLMKAYSNICMKAIEIIMDCEQNIALQHASARMQESMNWFNSYVINGGRISNENKQVN